jgi:hypothetical protein
MHLIDGGPPAVAPEPGEQKSPRWRRICNRFALEVWHWRLKRWIPRLVWLDDEIDVRITLMQDKLPQVKFKPGEEAAALKPLFSGAFAEMEQTFQELGINFDSGMGREGREWEWDWSLSGPISVRFRGRAKRPELRRESPKPTLVGTAAPRP